MRLGVLSNERLNPWLNWTTLGPPLLHSLVANGNAQLIAPPPVSSANLGEWLELLRYGPSTFCRHPVLDAGWRAT
jgi:hypothetical protein